MYLYFSNLKIKSNKKEQKNKIENRNRKEKKNEKIIWTNFQKKIHFSTLEIYQYIKIFK
jgi:hypothetical protein